MLPIDFADLVYQGQVELPRAVCGHLAANLWPPVAPIWRFPALEAIRILSTGREASLPIEVTEAATATGTTPSAGWVDGQGRAWVRAGDLADLLDLGALVAMARWYWARTHTGAGGRG